MDCDVMTLNGLCDKIVFFFCVVPPLVLANLRLLPSFPWIKNKGHRVPSSFSSSDNQKHEHSFVIEL